MANGEALFALHLSPRKRTCLVMLRLLCGVLRSEDHTSFAKAADWILVLQVKLMYRMRLLLYGHRMTSNSPWEVFCVLCLIPSAVAAPWVFGSIQRITPSLLCSCSAALLIITGIFQQYLVLRSSGKSQLAELQFYYVNAITCRDYGVIVVLVIDGDESDEIQCLKVSMFTALQPSSSLEELKLSLIFYRLQIQLLQAGIMMVVIFLDQQMALLQYQRENIHYLSEEGNGTCCSLIPDDQSGEGLLLCLLGKYFNQVNADLIQILGFRRALEMERISNLELQKKIVKLRSHSASTEQNRRLIDEPESLARCLSAFQLYSPFPSHRSKG
ncbi:hypothetical protein Syun_026572 [Stephania yunnanensis]|uniref:Uncharacterized protein n=1 Tax=Stephania yunnanensis TaxID=152371 RepID=A0AAP0EZ61_9MAGN